MQRFSAAGAFVLAFGDGVNVSTGGDVCTAASGNICGPGTAGAGVGQFVPRTGSGSNAPRLAIGTGGTVHVADYLSAGAGARLQRFDPGGAFLSQLAPLSGTSGASATLGFAVEPGGDFYVTTNGGERVRRYDPSGSLLQTFGQAQALALDAAGNLYARTRIPQSPVGAASFNVYDPAGTPLSATYGEAEYRIGGGIAARSTAAGDFYAIDEQGANQVAHIRFEPPGPVVLPRAAQAGASQSQLASSDTKATPVGNLTATLHARVNPEGRSTTVHFEYVDDAEFQANGFDNAARTPESDPIGSDFEVQTATFEIPCSAPGQPGCLIPDSVYRLRAVARNLDGEDTGPVASFRTLPPITLGALFATEVGTEDATLHGALNPNGIPTTARFQYVTEGEYQANGFTNAEEIPDSGAGAPPLDYGSGSAELSRSVLLSGLAPDTAYRYRYLATDFYGNFPGPEGRFHTFALPDPLDTNCPNQQFRTDLPSAHLPDCRAYEMVSPAEKGGGDVVAESDGVQINGQPEVNQARADGAKLTYTSPQKFAEPEGAGWQSQYIASRDPLAGWQSDNITPPRQTPPFYPAIFSTETQPGSFTADLCTSFLLQNNDRPLAVGDQVGYPDAYRRHNCGPSAGLFDLLTIRAPPTVPPGIVFPPYEPRVKGFSADGSLVVLRANDKLTTDASDARADNTNGQGLAFQLYIHNGTTLRLVSVLPSPGGTTPGAAADRSSTVGNKGIHTAVNNFTWLDTLENAVSEDGTRVYWETLDKTGSPAENKLYVRVNPAIAQSPVSAGACTRPERACTYPVSETVDAGRAEFEAASPDGNRALFSFSSGPHAGELYLYELAKAMAGQDPETLIAPGLPPSSGSNPQGILGASEDLSRVYFSSRAVLDAGAVAGRPNLYLHTEGEGTRLIATLADGNLDIFSFKRERDGHISRVSPDGSAAAFVSAAPLTGYDNTYTPADSPATEVFLYDAEANGGAGELLCVSCNPSGGRPTVTHGVVPTGHFAAILPAHASEFYAPRPLSADGNRLFFDSFDALLPTDTNEAKDVYQWQAPGSGNCEASDANYFEANGGCLSLISTGKDSRASSFVDASTDGSDVFFSSGERLHGADVDELIDIYDARIGGGFPPPPPSPGACDLDAGACEGPGTEAPDGSGAGSAVFEGPGNMQPRPQTKRCPKGKRKVTRGGRTRCVPKKAKKRRGPNHNRRAAR